MRETREWVILQVIRVILQVEAIEGEWLGGQAGESKWGGGGKEKEEKGKRGRGGERGDGKALSERGDGSKGGERRL